MKKFGYLLACLMVLMAGTSVYAITVDGDISDWDAASIISDPVDSAQVEMVNWGMKAEGGMIYSFIEISDNEVAGYFNAPTSGTKARRIVPGLWIDADHSDATALDATSTHQEWDGVTGSHAGIDINVEWGGGTPTMADTNHYSYWGAGDTAANAGSAWSTHSAPTEANYPGEHAYSGYVMEWAFPVSGLKAELLSYPDLVGLKSLVKVAMGIQANSRGTGNGITRATTWGYDLATPVYVALLPGDANEDGVVNFADYLNFSTGFGQTGAVGPDMWAMGDFNLDGTVNFSDYLVFSSNYGGVLGGSAVAVPEPISLVLLGLGGLLLRKRS